jgi:hypothetical protein
LQNSSSSWVWSLLPELGHVELGDVGERQLGIGAGDRVAELLESRERALRRLGDFEDEPVGR